MTAFPTYQIGTVSVSNGSNVVTGSGMVWSATNARSGDSISINGLPPVIISDVTDFTNLTLVLPWDGVTQASAPYVIIQNSMLRIANMALAQGVNDLLAKLEAKGLLWYLDPAWSEPSVAKPPYVGPEGQGLLKISTGQLWVMQGGVWVAAGVYKGLNFRGDWSAATAYIVNDVVTDAGSAYIAIAPSTNQAPPNATYWALLASKGDAATVAVGMVTTGAGGSAAAVTNVGTSEDAIFDFTIPQGKGYGGTSTTSLAIGTGSKAFTTQAGLAYTNGARVRASSSANTSNWIEGLVTYSGTTLTITVDKVKGTGTFADWSFNIAGVPGAGDLTSANNLSDLANAATALNNLSGVSYGAAQTIDLHSLARAQSNINLPAIHRRPVATWLPKWGAARANVIAGVSNAKLLCIGDSTMAGYGATPAYVNSAAFSLPAYLAAELTASGLNSSWQSRWSDNNASAVGIAIDTWDSRVTQGSFNLLFPNPTLGGRLFNATTAGGAWFTFTPTIPVDSFDLYWLGNTIGGTLACNINNATAATTINTAVPDGIYKTTKAGVPLGTSTFNLASTSGVTYFIGVVAYNSAAKEVSVINAGWGGGKAGDFNDASLYFSPLNALGVLAPDLTIIDLTINDAIQDTAIATYQTNLQAVIAKAKISGDVILVGGVPIDPTYGSATLAKQTAINNMAAALAAKNSVNFISMFDLWGSFTAINNAGWSADLVIHPNAAGYAAQAALLAPYLL